eukprot:2105853-Prymnesium_polylepis.1
MGEVFTFLLAGDLHDDASALAQLKKDAARCRWHVMSRRDAVVSAGDFTSAPQGPLEPVNRSYYSARVRRALRELAWFRKPIFWVPGNHEPACFYTKESCAEETGLTFQRWYAVNVNTTLRPLLIRVNTTLRP